MDFKLRVPEPHMGRAARNFLAVSVVSKAFHPHLESHLPDSSIFKFTNKSK